MQHWVPQFQWGLQTDGEVDGAAVGTSVLGAAVGDAVGPGLGLYVGEHVGNPVGEHKVSISFSQYCREIIDTSVFCSVVHEYDANKWVSLTTDEINTYIHKTYIHTYIHT